MGVSGNPWSCPKEATPIVLYDGERGIGLKQCREIGHHFKLRDFWRNLCSSIKHIKAPYLSDWEQGIALYTMQGIRASSLIEEEVSWFFLSCGRNLGYILELGQG